MIQLIHVHKAYPMRHGGRRKVLDDVSVEFPPGSRVGILGVNGAGKSTLLRLLSGRELPDSGRIIRKGLISFPLGFTGTFETHATAKENIRFLASIYDMDFEHVARWVEEFAELGHYFSMPVSAYSSGMAARLAFATSLAFDFDVYLVDEAIETGDEHFRTKCSIVLSERLENASLILVTQNIHTIRRYCRQAAVLHDGQLKMYPSVDSAADAYEIVLRTHAV